MTKLVIGIVAVNLIFLLYCFLDNRHVERMIEKGCLEDIVSYTRVWRCGGDK